MPNASSSYSNAIGSLWHVSKPLWYLFMDLSKNYALSCPPFRLRSYASDSMVGSAQSDCDFSGFLGRFVEKCMCSICHVYLELNSYFPEQGAMKVEPHLLGYHLQSTQLPYMFSWGSQWHPFLAPPFKRRETSMTRWWWPHRAITKFTISLHLSEVPQWVVSGGLGSREL